MYSGMVTGTPSTEALVTYTNRSRFTALSSKCLTPMTSSWCQTHTGHMHAVANQKGLPHICMGPVGRNNSQILTQRQQQCTGKIGRPLSQRYYRSLPLIHEDTLQVARLWSPFESLRHIFRMKIWTSTWRKTHPVSPNRATTGKYYQTLSLGFWYSSRHTGPAYN